MPVESDLIYGPLCVDSRIARADFMLLVLVQVLVLIILMVGSVVMLFLVRVVLAMPPAGCQLQMLSL